MKGSVGLLGGAFDPIHNGHLAIAREALAQCELSSVVFVPYGEPPDPDAKVLSGPEDRYQMVATAIAKEEQLSVSRIEIDRPGPSYTIDTLRAMKDDCPQGICFIVGADRLSQIASWREPEAILALVPIITALRGDVLEAVFRSAPFDEASVFLLNMPRVDVSSTLVRERVARGEPIREWVPPEVAAYIEAHGLYREAGRRRSVEGGWDTE